MTNRQMINDYKRRIEAIKEAIIIWEDHTQYNEECRAKEQARVAYYQLLVKLDNYTEAIKKLQNK